MKRLTENLNGENTHYLYPFFWQHGESEDVLAEMIEKMNEQGIYNLCIESRPHPDFLEEGWWKTMDFIIKEAKHRNMKLWILDDAKFPSGYANGRVPDEYKKKYLNYRRYDFIGNGNIELDISVFCDIRLVSKDRRHRKDRFFKAILAENNCEEKEAYKEDTLIDVSSCYHEGKLYLSLDKKHFSVFVLYETECGEDRTANYLDPMRKEAVQILIDEVYEKHYQHYPDEFGKTIKGFFSDEPRFGNIKGTDASIGRKAMPLPWNQYVYEQLQALPMFKDEKLIKLFIGQSEEAYRLRYDYMDIVSKLYSENFSNHIGNWCRKRGIDYIGHTIEDNNAHARLGYGAGHYFRGISGQTIAGIDVIGGQIIPGMDYFHEAFSTGGSDGEFYHYALAKLGASSAKLDFGKKGQLMCEAFGAYGWVEGLKMMKWITDHLLSHGVNMIVPHAFDPAPFPDRDCPPHFYAHGLNPQYPYFHFWSAYADRMCHLLNNGFHRTSIGVLYHAFAEWSGAYMPIQKVLKLLQQNQIECDIISEDYLIDAFKTERGYEINGYIYETLIVPYAQRLPREIINKLKTLSNTARIIFIDEFPQGEEVYLKQCEVMPLTQLQKALNAQKTIQTSSYEPHLTVYRYAQPDGDVWLLTNEDVCETINTEITINEKSLVIYDAYTNEIAALDTIETEQGSQFHLCLPPYQSIVLVQGTTNKKVIKKGTLYTEIKEVNVSMKAYDELEYSSSQRVKIDGNLHKKYPYFTGSLKYEFDLEYNSELTMMELEEAYEIIELIVNGKSLGAKIAPPYQFKLENMLQMGTNHIEIIAINNLGRALRDPMSSYLASEPLGLTESIRIYKKSEN